MKLELELNDDLTKRIVHRADLFHVTPAQFIEKLLEQHVPSIPNPQGVIAMLEEQLANPAPAAPDEYWEEFTRNVDAERTGRKLFPPEKKGVTW